MDDSSQSSFYSKIELGLKGLLEQVLSYLEKFINSQSDLVEIQSQLQDYDDIPELVQIISNLFSKLTERIDEQLQTNLFTSNDQEDSQSYEKLEIQIQKYEQDIRNHIKLEQQLRLYAESIQQKLDESEANRNQLLESTKKMINEVKRENQKLSENLKEQKNQQRDITSKLEQLENKDREQQMQLQEFYILQEKIKVLQNMLKENMIAQIHKPNDYLSENQMNSSMQQLRQSSAGKMNNIAKTEQTSSNRLTHGQVTMNIIQRKQNHENIKNIEKIQKKIIIQSVSSSKENHLDRLYEHIKGQQKVEFMRDNPHKYQNVINSF